MITPFEIKISKEMNIIDRLSVDIASKKFRDIMEKAHPHHKK